MGLRDPTFPWGYFETGLETELHLSLQDKQADKDKSSKTAGRL